MMAASQAPEKTALATMTMRERMLVVVQGREPDRVPFAQYTGIADERDVWPIIGREKMGLLKWVAAYRIDHPNCRLDHEEIERGGLKGWRRTMHTPSGSLWEEHLTEPVLNSSHISRHFVQEPEDYRVLMEFLRDAVVADNRAEVESVIAGMGDDGLPHTSVLRTPFQQLWVQWVSIEKLPLHLIDEPELMAEVISVMADIERRVFRVAAESPAPYIVFPDNVTAPIIGERYFHEYCVPPYDELAEMLGPDRPVFVHMDGDLKPIWDAIGQSEVRGLDSFSPPPDNDTSVAEALELWPEMRIWANFPSSVHIAKPERIYEVAMELLEISENVPPERWRVSYPEIVRAIDDFYGL